MKPRMLGMASLLVLGAFVCVGSGQDAASLRIPQLSETSAQRETRMQWFRDAKLGMFVHWGPAAISGEEISWGMAGRIEGGPEHMKVPRETYMNLYRKFNPEQFDADQWLRLAKAAGMKYIVFITKHHDGFSMWPTKQVRFAEGSGFAPRYSVADTPYRKDICRMIQQAAKAHDVKLGWYYSTRDWTHPDYLQGDNKRYNDYYQAQVRELLTEYGPVDLMWFDHCFGNWNQYTIPHLFEMMYAVKPDLIVNNRAARGLQGIPAEFLALDAADFDTPENRMGTFQHGRAWESCMILSPHADHGGWSYRPDGKTRSGRETIQLLSSAACGDGNMLLNIAPLPTGEIRAEEKAVLEELAPWTQRYGEVIYGTRGGPWVNGRWGGSTHRGNVVYVHVLQWNGDSLKLRPLKEKILQAVTLTGGSVAFKQTDMDVTLSLAREHQNPIVTLIKLTLDRAVGEIQSAPAVITQIVPDPDGTIVMQPDAAETTGGVKAERRLDVPNLGYWTNPQGTVSWKTAIASPGRYVVKAETASPYSGVRFTVAVGNQSVTGEAPNTESHDNYVDVVLGTVEFPNVENVVVRVTAAEPGRWQPINLRNVKLIPKP